MGVKSDIKISSRYQLYLEDVPQKQEQTENLWIRRFPDVKTAVDAGARKLERTVSFNINLDIGAGVELLKAKVLGANERTFYIYYEAE